MNHRKTLLLSVLAFFLQWIFQYICKVKLNEVRSVIYFVHHKNERYSIIFFLQWKYSFRRCKIQISIGIMKTAKLVGQFKSVSCTKKLGWNFIVVLVGV